jgi:Rrf2 family protein
MLALQPSDKITNQTISDHLQVSEHHLAKVHQKLVRHGLLKAERGPSGGFVLAKPANKIKLIEIVEAIDGPFNPSQCLLGREHCDSDCCLLGQMSNSINDQIRTFLNETTADKLWIATGKLSEHLPDVSSNDARCRQRTFSTEKDM